MSYFLKGKQHPRSPMTFVTRSPHVEWQHPHPVVQLSCSPTTYSIRDAELLCKASVWSVHVATFVYVPLLTTCPEGSPVKSGVDGAKAVLTCWQPAFIYTNERGTCPQRGQPEASQTCHAGVRASSLQPPSISAWELWEKEALAPCPSWAQQK